MIEERYMKLNGDPIHEPLWKTFHLAGDVQVGALITALAAAASYSTPEEALTHFAMGATAITTLNVINRPLVSFLLTNDFRDPEKKLCIDTAPDEKSQPTNPNHMRAANAWHFVSMLRLGIAGIFTAIDAGHLGNMVQHFTAGSELNRWDVFDTVYDTAWMTYEARLFNRFNKVSKGEWIVTDTPKKVEVKQEENSFFKLPLPQPN